MAVSVASATGLSGGAVDGMESVDKSAWNGMLCLGQAPLRHRYLSAWQRAELPGLVYRPIVVHDAEGGLVAGCPAYHYDLDMASIQKHVVSDVLQVVRRVMPGFMITRVFEMGSSTPLVPPFLRAQSLSTGRAAQALLDAGVAEMEAGDAELMIVQNFHRQPPDDDVLEALQGHGFHRVPIPPTVVVELPFGDFDDYLGAMRAGYRRRARKVLKASADLRVELVDDFAPLVPELARLWQLVYQRADEVKREVLGEPFFAAIAPLEYLRVLALKRPDGSIASYALLLDDRPRLHFLYTGFEESAGRDEGAYFRLLYEIVRYALERGFASVNLGITTLEPKLDLGGSPVQLYGWIRHRSSFLQKAFARLAAGPFAPSLPGPRRVFK